MKDNSRGLRRLVRKLEKHLLPTVPFPEDQPGKGLWEWVSSPPPHVWARYLVEADVEAPINCVVLSDLHVGSHARDLERLERIVTEILAVDVDVVLLPGDFVNMQIFGKGRIRPETIAEVISPLMRKAPAFAVMGNHDSEYGSHLVGEALAERGVTVLRNASSEVKTSGGSIWIAGLEDASTGYPDVVTALRDVPALGRTLLMAHDPASFAAVPSGLIATVCGHTHGGQVRLPFVGPVINASSAPLAWTHGRITEAHGTLIISAGLGTSGLPIRLNCPPEILLLRIEPAAHRAQVSEERGTGAIGMGLAT